MNGHAQQKPVSVNYCGGTRTPWLLLLTFLLVAGILLSSCGTPASEAATVTKTPTHIPTPTPVPPTPTPTPITPTPVPTPTYPPAVAPSAILGVAGDPKINYAGIPWVRLSYPTCGAGGLSGIALKNTIAAYHKEGVRVMLSVCQWTSGPNLFQTAPLLDAAQGGADAVQCGNEQMKSGAFNMYITPSAFARFYDNCQRIMHTVRPGIPIIIGSLDPLIAGTGYGQVAYLNEMQYAMNTQVHPGGNWNWRTQIVGLIDSWHNGYPSSAVNNLYGLFIFWAQQIGVSLNGGGLGKHLWVIEGTGCFKGCGIDPYSGYQVAVSHVLSLITDVRTAMGYSVPFFYFSGTDFLIDGSYWPIGIMNLNGHPKPLRQDLWMGARTLTMSCAVGTRVVQDQEQLLMRLYMNCALPYNYAGILES